MSSDLKNIVEAVLMVSDTAVTVVKIQSLFERGSQPSAEEIKQEIQALQKDCENRGVELHKAGSGYRYQTNEKYADWIRKLQATRPPRMSRALLETLAIIAYRQPVTRGDIEEIRGVGVTTEIMQRLLEREWIKEVGVRDVPGHQALFGTTAKFLSYFDLESLKELPPLMQERELGEIARGMDTPPPPELLEAMQKQGQQDVFLQQADSASLETLKVNSQQADSPPADSGEGDELYSEADSAGEFASETNPALETEPDAEIKQHQPEATAPELVEPESVEKALTDS